MRKLGEEPPHLFRKMGNDSLAVVNRHCDDKNIDECLFLVDVITTTLTSINREKNARTERINSISAVSERSESVRVPVQRCSSRSQQALPVDVVASKVVSSSGVRCSAQPAA